LIFTRTGNATVLILHYDSLTPVSPLEEYKTFYCLIMPYIYSYVVGWNHSYNFCLTFCWWVRQNLNMMVLTMQQNSHKVAQSNLQQSFSVNLWSGIPDNCLVGAHVIRGLIT
jgi:hypothetical protein